MNLKEVMSELESLGTEQNRKTYQRHGSGPNLFGVSFANLKALAKKIKSKKTKTEHELAIQLWKTKNVDAQSLATMILDPKKLDEKTASNWANGIDYSLLAGLLAGCIAESSFAQTVINNWTDSKDEYIRQCGYDTLAHSLKNKHAINDADCKKFLTKIEKELKSSPNRARYAMNGALIAIGIYKPDLTEEALRCADHIGVVEVDHGQTECKTPDARAYILKALSRTPKAKVLSKR